MLHHDGSALYVGDPAPALGDTVQVFLRADAATDVHVRSTADGEPAFAAAVPDRPGWWRAAVVVRNPVTRYRWLVDGHEVALGLLMTLPGVPMIFAGDEFGRTG